MKRRTFLQSSSVIAAWASPMLASTARPKAPFRVVYSNDTTNILSCVSPFHKKGEPFRAGMLEATVDEVTGLVDAHFLQPGLGMVPMWPSRVVPLKEHYAWIRERYGQKPDSYGQFVLNGGDVVKIFVDRCRKKGQVPFVSVRMNDAHHKEYTDPKPGEKTNGVIGMSVTRFYAEHPELRIKPGSLRGTDLVQNWAEPVVREQKLALIRELCENYDLDGLELDYLRHPSFFRLEETSREQRCSIMNGFLSEVRGILDRTARNGRRRWLCARIPCHTISFEQLGLDLPGLVTAGLDMVNASNHYFTSQRQDLAKIRKQVPDAALYYELCHTIWNGPKVAAGYDVFPFRRATREHLHTSAHLAYARGADGISLFNFAYYREYGRGEGRGPFGEPPFEALAAFRDPAKLASEPQHWFNSSAWRAPGMKPLPVPHAVDPGKAVRFTFDLASPKGGWKGTARLRIQADKPVGESVLMVAFNGTPIEVNPDRSEPFPVPYPCLMGQPDELRAWSVPAALLREGGNVVEVKTGAGSNRVTVAFLDLAMA